jgi:CubicO group peptidase (beta-lactamase class C family)
MLHKPGRFVSYCNSGVVVLGRLIEVLRDATWDDVLRERIVRPLGLERTYTLAEEAIVHRVAVGHPDEKDGEPQPGAVWGIPRSAGPAGLILSTAADTLAFAAMHIDDGRDVLESGSARAMRERQSIGVQAADDPRGLGWYLYPWEGPAVLGHDGGTFGQLSFLRVVPERRFAAVLLTNSWGGALVHVDLFGELFRERVGIEIPPLPSPPDEPVTMDADRYTGDWTWQGLHVRVEEDGAGLVANLVIPQEDPDAPPLIPPIKMTALGGDRFRLRVPPLPIDSVLAFLETDASGRFAFADLRGRLVVRP